MASPQRKGAVSQLGSADQEMLRLGQRLRELRLARGLGVRTLARSINVSASLISHIELGKGAPSVKTLYALVAAYGIPLSQIFVEPVPSPANDTQVRFSGPAKEPRQGRSSVPSDYPLESTPEKGSNRFIQRARGRRSIQLEHGFRWECLTPGTDTDVEFMETIIEVGGGRPESEMKSHNGTEYGLVLSGKLGVKITFDRYILGPGDSIRFESSLPHCMWNAGDEPVHSVWFVRDRSK
jgi:transcriptional regulator with XRE-family HTH domain